MDAVSAYRHERDCQCNEDHGSSCQVEEFRCKVFYLPRCKIKSQLFWIPWLSPISTAERFLHSDQGVHICRIRSKSTAGLWTSPEVSSAAESCSSECLQCFDFSLDVQLCFRDAAVDSVHGLKCAARPHKEKHWPIPMFQKSHQGTGSETCC